MGKAKVAPTNSKAGVVCRSSWDRDNRNHQRTDGKKNFKFYSDSQIALGYITNDARRLYV